MLRHGEKNRQNTQTWYTFPANRSDLARKSGSMGTTVKTNPGSKSYVTKGLPEKCKESVFESQILCRNQANPQILWCYQAKVTESLQKSGALSPSRTGRLLFLKRRSSRHARRSSCCTRDQARTSVSRCTPKTTVSPAIFEQYLNKNFY